LVECDDVKAIDERGCDDVPLDGITAEPMQQQQRGL